MKQSLEVAPRTQWAGSLGVMLTPISGSLENPRVIGYKSMKNKFQLLFPISVGVLAALKTSLRLFH
jgi:hypothetical protein